MVRARVDRLERPDKELLKLASVIGAEFSLELLEPLCETESPISPRLARLESRSHILQLDPSSYRFKHPIVHDVVYNVLLLQRRRELHGSIARMIEGRHKERGLELQYEALAHHYGRSDDRARATHYGELAGIKAERAFSLDQARIHYAHALESLDELPPTPERMQQRVDLSLRWAAALVHNPLPGQLQVMLRSLEYANRLGYTRGVARCLSWSGWIEYTHGNQLSAIDYNQRCLSMRGEIDDRHLLAQAEANIGISCVMAGRHDEAIDRIARARASVSPTESPSAAAGTGYALAHLALLSADRGEFDRASAQLDEGRTLLESSGRFALVGALDTIEGIMCSLRGDFKGVGRSASRVRAVAERIDGSYQRQMATALAGLHLVYEQNDRRGIELLRGAALALESRGMGLALSWTFASLAEALLFLHEDVEAATHAESALARARFGDGLGRAAALRALAVARYRAGEGADFAAALAAASGKGSRREEALTELARAECGGRANDLPARFQAMSMPFYVARSESLLPPSAAGSEREHQRER
jgi:tetratricopeptide (TPR) repeat protein